LLLQNHRWAKMPVHAPDAAAACRRRICADRGQSVSTCNRKRNRHPYANDDAQRFARRVVEHGWFALPAEPGLSEALAQGLNWAEAVRPTKIPNLSLLPRGSFTQRAGELFISALAIKFLTETAEAYDYVILDTAPVMAADDVTSLAPHVEGVLFVVRAECTSARVARAALDLLYQRQVRVLGLVFNAGRPGRSDYYYYHKYKDYYPTYPGAKAGKA